MQGHRQIPNATSTALDSFLEKRMPPSASSVSALHRETTVCYAYMCAYAYGCSEKAARSAQVLKRRCIRYLPQPMRIEPHLSDFCLDLLARRRRAGRRLSPVTVAALDRLRPDGPIRRSV